MLCWNDDGQLCPALASVALFLHDNMARVRGQITCHCNAEVVGPIIACITITHAVGKGIRTGCHPRFTFSNVLRFIMTFANPGLVATCCSSCRVLGRPVTGCAANEAAAVASCLGISASPCLRVSRPLPAASFPRPNTYGRPRPATGWGTEELSVWPAPFAGSPASQGGLLHGGEMKVFDPGG